MSFRFIHLADLHLDTPFKEREETLRSRLRQALRTALMTAVDLAVDRQADAFLIAGDLFDSATLSFASERFLIEELQRLGEAGIPVCYVTGNHDPNQEGRRLRIRWPDNLLLFNTETPRTVTIHDREGRALATVTGAGHGSGRVGTNLAGNFPVLDDSLPRVALLHALVTGSRGAGEHDRYAPCTTADLAGKGYCYWALGHIHTRGVVCEGPLAVYPGNPVGRDYGETGERGCYYVEIDDQRRVKSEFVPLAPLRWERIAIEGLQGKEIMSLEEELGEAIGVRIAGLVPENLLLRVELKGPAPLYRELRQEENLETLAGELQSKLHLLSLSLEAGSLVRPVDPERYRGEPDLLGNALELLTGLTENDDLLLKLAPERLAGAPGSNRRERLAYLKSLLPGLDRELTARMLEGDME